LNWFTPKKDKTAGRPSPPRSGLVAERPAWTNQLGTLLARVALRGPQRRPDERERVARVEVFNSTWGIKPVPIDCTLITNDLVIQEP
jgi:hypothetical protein